MNFAEPRGQFYCLELRNLIAAGQVEIERSVHHGGVWMSNEMYIRGAIALPSSHQPPQSLLNVFGSPVLCKSGFGTARYPGWLKMLIINFMLGQCCDLPWLSSISFSLVGGVWLIERVAIWVGIQPMRPFVMSVWCLCLLPYLNSILGIWTIRKCTGCALFYFLCYVLRRRSIDLPEKWVDLFYLVHCDARSRHGSLAWVWFRDVRNQCRGGCCCFRIEWARTWRQTC